MRLPRNGRRHGSGFTLIELLVVVTIILILVAMLMAAGFKVLAQRKVLEARTEITQLTAAVDNFKRHYKVDYLPSRFKLCENCNDYYVLGPGGLPTFASQLDADSVQFLSRMFPRANFNYVPGSATGTRYDWDGNGSYAPVGTKWILEGDQCIVFFLGGIQVPSSVGPPGCLGFSTNPGNPTLAPSVSPDRIRPFYEFKPSRLAFLPHPAMVVAGPPVQDFRAPFYSYLDPWGDTPYVYFTCYKTANGYNRYFPGPPTGTFGVGSPQPGLSDCQSQNSSNGVWPYIQASAPTTRYYREDSFQILCAGPDRAFGAGGNWTPLTAGAVYPAGSAGADDLSNFYGTAMGVAGQ